MLTVQVQYMLQSSLGHAHVMHGCKIEVHLTISQKVNITIETAMH